MRWRTRADSRLRVLESLPELGRLSRSDLRGLLAQFDQVDVPAGTVIARAGRLCTEYLVVIDGCLETRTDAGSQAVLAGDSYGWEAMCGRSVNPATVLAASDARLLVMGWAQFRAVTALRRQHGCEGALDYPGAVGACRPRRQMAS